MKVLAEIDTPLSRKALIDLTRSEITEIRRESVSTLGDLGDESVIAALKAALKDKEEAVRTEAAKALGRTGDKRAIPALEAALKDPDYSVRTAAKEALRQLRSSRPPAGGPAESAEGQSDEAEVK